MTTLELLLTGTVVTAGVLLAIAPVALPWPQRVRWTVVAHMMDYGSSSFWAPDLREVTLRSVERVGERLTLTVVEVGHATCDALSFICTASTSPDLLSMLDDWCVLRTPMMLYLDRRDGASLAGPVASVGELHRVASPSRSR
jgi:hypothetical protein